MKAVNTWIRQILQTGFVVVALILAGCQCVVDCQKLSSAVHPTSAAPPCHQHQTPQKQDPGSHACPQSQVFAEDRSLAQAAPVFVLAAVVPSFEPVVLVLTRDWSESLTPDRPPKSFKPLLSVVLRV